MKERDDMYFPYLRGRQFELIALRELVEKDVLSSKIIPVIEPVKLSSTLLKTIEMYGNNNKKLAFITNPGVGSFKSEWREEKNKKLKENLKEYLKENDNILYMHILKPHENQDDFINKHAESMGTICDNRDAIPVYTEFFSDRDVKYNLIPDESGFRRKIRRIILELMMNHFRKIIYFIRKMDMWVFQIILLLEKIIVKRDLHHMQ